MRSSASLISDVARYAAVNNVIFFFTVLLRIYATDDSEPSPAVNGFAYDAETFNKPSR